MSFERRMPMVKISLKKLFQNTFEGHQGRPGKVGGSLPKASGGHSKRLQDKWAEERGDEGGGGGGGQLDPSEMAIDFLDASGGGVWENADDDENGTLTLKYPFKKRADAYRQAKSGLVRLGYTRKGPPLGKDIGTGLYAASETRETWIHPEGLTASVYHYHDPQGGSYSTIKFS
jgi:hypothetical protein